MAKAGKIIALIGGLLTFIGTWLFSLTTIPGAPTLVNSGIGGVMQLILVFQSGPFPWQLWIFIIGYIIFLLSFALQLLGIKSRIAAFFGTLLPLTVVVFIFLAYFDLWYDGFAPIFLFFSSEALVETWVPMTFGFGLGAANIWPGLIIDLGTFIVGAGSILSFVSVFLTREDY